MHNFKEGNSTVRFLDILKSTNWLNQFSRENLELIKKTTNMSAFYL